MLVRLPTPVKRSGRVLRAPRRDEGEIGDTTVAYRRLMSQALRASWRVFKWEVEHHAHLHQPAAREDRCDVRKPGDHDGRPRPSSSSPA